MQECGKCDVVQSDYVDNYDDYHYHGLYELDDCHSYDPKYDDYYDLREYDDYGVSDDGTYDTEDYQEHVVLLKVSLPLPQSVVTVPVPTPDPAQSPADEMVTHNIHLCLVPARRPTPTGSSRLTRMLPCLFAAAAVPPTGSPIMARFGPLNLTESHESPVQLSPNCVRPDFDVDTEDLYPLFDTSPVLNDDLSLISQATTQASISTDSDGEAESFDNSAGVSPAMSASMSTTHRGAAARVTAAGSSSVVDQGRNRSRPAASIRHGFLSLRRILCLAPSLFREGPFDAATCHVATSEHHLFTNQRDGCP